MKEQKGFIAIITALIITFILVILIFTTGLTSFFARFNSLDVQYKRKSLALSEACVNRALLKISQEYTYSGDETYTIPGTSNTCKISPIIVLAGDNFSPQKSVAIKSIASYPAQNGSWSVNKITATVSNPSAASGVPAPSCSFFDPNPPNINPGEEVNISWETSGNATSFSIERYMGSGHSPITISGSSIPSGSVKDYPSSSATYRGTVSGPGGETFCLTQVFVGGGYSAACADTVVMLSGQIETGDRDDEKSAVESLLIAYNRVTPNPLTSIGTYPGLNGSAALIPGPTDPYPNGQLTDTEDYPTLYALNNLIASTNINANPPASNV